MTDRPTRDVPLADVRYALDVVYASMRQVGVALSALSACQPSLEFAAEILRRAAMVAQWACPERGCRGILDEHGVCPFHPKSEVKP